MQQQQSHCWLVRVSYDKKEKPSENCNLKPNVQGNLPANIFNVISKCQGFIRHATILKCVLYL
jgi:hypothetical protein